MSGQWKKVVQVRFKGGRYEERALDQIALAEVLQLQKVLTETAKELWRHENPESGRLPNRFEERVNLCLRKICKGSTSVDLEVYLEKPEQGELWDREPTEANAAVKLACEVFTAAGRAQLLPERLPKWLVGDYAKIGQGLQETESLEFGPPGKRRVPVTARQREHLLQFAESSYEDTVEVTGEVLEVDVKHRRLQLWKDANTPIAVAFNEDQEEKVTRALAEHRSVRLKVVGRGVHSPQGKLENIKEVTELRVSPAGEEQFDPHARPIEEIIAEIASEVPPEEWAKVPKDLAENLDHYLYGAPRR
jgi:hypothetical protein